MNCTYYPNYFSIDDIVVTQEKVPCVTEQDLANLGFLDQSHQSADLKANQEVQLPLWYILQVQKERGRNQFYEYVRFQYFQAHPMSTGAINVKIPNIYKATYSEICKADATAVDLGKLNKHFYEFGRYVSNFDRNGFVGRMIYETCRSRMKYLKDLCNNIHNEQRNEQRLDHIEYSLFQKGCKTNKKFTEWLQESTVNIKTSEMVVNHRKRKRALMEAESAIAGSQKS